MSSTTNIEDVESPNALPKAVKDNIPSVVLISSLISSLGLYVFVGSAISVPFFSESTTTVLNNLLWVFAVGYLVPTVSYTWLFLTHIDSFVESVTWLVTKSKLYITEWMMSILLIVLIGAFTSLPIVWGAFFFTAISSAMMEQLAYYSLMSSPESIQKPNLSADELEEMSGDEIRSITSS